MRGIYSCKRALIWTPVPAIIDLPLSTGPHRCLFYGRVIGRPRTRLNAILMLPTAVFYSLIPPDEDQIVGCCSARAHDSHHVNRRMLIRYRCLSRLYRYISPETQNLSMYISVVHRLYKCSLVTASAVL